DRVLVMYAGRVVEEGSVDDIFYKTAMPYTWSLLRSLPRMDADKNKRRFSIKGQPPHLINPPKGCQFHPRCPFRSDACLEGQPPLKKVQGEHQSACILSLETFQRKKAAFPMMSEGADSK